MLSCNMAEWRQFQNEQRQKKACERKKVWRRIHKGQRLSNCADDEFESDGKLKQHKCTRIKPREFVLFEFNKITFDNVVNACQKYSAAHIDKDMVCDILTGESGPSRKKTSQIPDHKAFYVRFINYTLIRQPGTVFKILV